MTSLLDPQELQRVAAPLEQAWTLPPGMYTRADVFELEARELFSKDWVCVARAEQLPEPGDYLCVDVVDQPIVVARGRDGELHASSRVCLHRAMPIVEGRGNTRRFTCPYHRWTYELDGQLRGAPMMEGAEGFDARSCRLPRVALEVWQGFVFVNMNEQADPLSEQISGLSELVRNYNFGSLEVVETVSFDSPWNWKILVENFMEAYHHIGTHADTLQALYPARDTRVPDNGGQPWAFLRMPGTVDVTPTLFPDLEEDERSDLFAAAVFPHFLFAASGQTAVWYQLEPRGHSCMDLKIHILAPAGVAQSLDAGAREAMVEQVRVIHMEDIAANEGPWRGLNAPLTGQGRLSPFEKAIWQLNQYWLERLNARERSARIATFAG